jgi:AcrR family transcriptional regulator
MIFVKVSKEKILDTARLLFNQKGLAAVTARLISIELEISPGSFSYHFPDKSRLVVELYRSLVDEMNSCLMMLQTDEISIKPFLNTFRKCAHVQFKYKFFFLNLSEILINYPAIKQLHKRAVIRERVLAKQLFQHYLASGIIKKDTTMPDLKLVLKQSQILFAYWIADAELGKFKSEAQAIWYYTEVCCATIKPFLNNKSKNEYITYFKKK